MTIATDAPTEPQNYEELRWLTDVYMQTQKLRIANSNRVYASGPEGTDDNSPEPFVASLVSRLEDLEGDIFKRMKLVVKDHPAWPWLSEVKGIGPTLATKILGLIGDIEKFSSVSKLWSFAGYGLTENGERQRPVKGERLTYNRRLKTALYLAGDSFIKSRSPYRDLYDARKRIYRLKKQIRPMQEILGLDTEGLPDRATTEGKKAWDVLIKKTNAEAGAPRDEACWSDGHVDNAARRYMVKIFLSHIWVVWREAEGLPTTDPFVIAHQPEPGVIHTHVIDPWEFASK